MSRKGKEIIVLSSDTSHSDESDISKSPSPGPSTKTDKSKKKKKDNYKKVPGGFYCNKCSSVIKGKLYHFERHMERSHPSKKIYKCNVCNRSYTTEKAWRQHMKREALQRSEAGRGLSPISESDQEEEQNYAEIRRQARSFLDMESKVDGVSKKKNKIRSRSSKSDDFSYLDEEDESGDDDEDEREQQIISKKRKLKKRPKVVYRKVGKRSGKINRKLFVSSDSETDDNEEQLVVVKKRKKSKLPVKRKRQKKTVKRLLVSSDSDDDGEEYANSELTPRYVKKRPIIVQIAGPELRDYGVGRDPLLNVPMNYNESDALRQVVENQHRQIQPSNVYLGSAENPLVLPDEQPGTSEVQSTPGDRSSMGGASGAIRGNNKSQTNDANPEDPAEYETDHIDREIEKSRKGTTHLLGARAWKDWPPILTYFACLATFFLCQRNEDHIVYQKAARVKKEAKKLLKEALKRKFVVEKRRKFNLKIVQDLSDCYDIIVHVWSHKKRLLVDDSRNILNFDFTRPELNIVRSSSGRFCIITNVGRFVGQHICTGCHRIFCTRFALYKHKRVYVCPYDRFMELHPNATRQEFFETPLTDYMLERRYPGGKVTPKVTFGERLKELNIYIPDNFVFKQYFCVSDIESFLRPFPHKFTEGEEGVIYANIDALIFMDVHKPASVSVISNLGGRFSQAQCFLNMDGSSNFMEAYCNYLHEMADCQYDILLRQHEVIFEQLDMKEKECEMFDQDLPYLQRIRKLHRDMKQDAKMLVVYFYNASYDLNCLIRHGLCWFLQRIDEREQKEKFDSGEIEKLTCTRPKAIKNGNQYINVKSQKLLFRDILKFCPGKISLPAFLFSYGIEDRHSKMAFPYQILRSHLDMWFSTDQIKYEHFFSELKQENVLESACNGYKFLRDNGMGKEAALKELKRTDVPPTGRQLFEQLQRLFIEKGMKYLYSYLALYCSTDCCSLLLAIEKMQDVYRELSGLELIHFNTLPSMSFNFALREMAKFEDNTLNYLVKLGPEAFDLVQDGLRGGATWIGNRLSVSGFTKIRAHSIAAENQKTVQCQQYLDANCLYGSTCHLNCPVLGLYSIRRKKEKFLLNQLHEKGLLALSWLQWIEKVEYKTFVRTALHRNGEKTIVLSNGKRAKLDGYAPTGQNDDDGSEKGISFEFHDISHGHPSLFSDQQFNHGINPITKKNNREMYENTLERDRLISEHKMIESHVVMWSHVWRERIRADVAIFDFVETYINSLIPDQVQEEMTWEEMLQFILDQRIHGVVRCSVRVPADKIKDFSIYPPLWEHKKLTRENLAPTELQYALKYGLLTSSQKSLCNVMDAKDTVLSTDMLTFYVKELGLECYDISLVCQFKGSAKPLEQFFTRCLKYREEGRVNNNPIQADNGKLWPNSFYGSSLLRLDNRKSTCYVAQKKLKMYTNRMNYNDSAFAGPSWAPNLYTEVDMKRFKVAETYPKQFGFWVLQISKSVLLRFIYKVLDYYLEQDSWEINCLDTDGLVVSIAGEDLKSVCKSEKLAEFTECYGDIFVDDPSKSHVPFLFKCEKKSRIFVGLATKTYYMAGEDSFRPKLACKGIPKRTQENANLVSLVNYMTTVFDMKEERAQAIVRGIRCDSTKNMCSYMCSKAGLSRFSAKSAFFPCALCPFPLSLKDNTNLLQQIYPYKDNAQCHDFNSLWEHLLKLAEIYPEMSLELPENFLRLVREQVEET